MPSSGVGPHPAMVEDSIPGAGPWKNSQALCGRRRRHTYGRLSEPRPRGRGCFVRKLACPLPSSKYARASAPRPLPDDQLLPIGTSWHIFPPPAHRIRAQSASDGFLGAPQPLNPILHRPSHGAARAQSASDRPPVRPPDPNAQRQQALYRPDRLPTGTSSRSPPRTDQCPQTSRARRRCSPRSATGSPGGSGSRPTRQRAPRRRGRCRQR